MLAKILDKTEIEDFWPKIEHHVLKLKNSQIKPEYVKQYLIDGSYFAMVAEQDGVCHGVMIFYFVEYPSEWSCRIMGLAGVGIDRWSPFLRDFENIVKDYGCSSIELQGRKGWERFLKDDDYEFESITLRKKI
jgi:hypothetical protein